jgi:ATP diphosphatase
LQKRAAGVNFDWPGSVEVMEKLDEELAELRKAIAEGDAAAIDDEMGDLLFTCVNLARHLQLDAESSLRRASRKFEKRFAVMEELSLKDGTSLAQLDEAGLATYWQIAKSLT